MECRSKKYTIFNGVTHTLTHLHTHTLTHISKLYKGYSGQAGAVGRGVVISDLAVSYLASNKSIRHNICFLFF